MRITISCKPIPVITECSRIKLHIYEFSFKLNNWWSIWENVFTHIIKLWILRALLKFQAAQAHIKMACVLSHGDQQGVPYASFLKFPVLFHFCFLTVTIDSPGKQHKLRCVLMWCLCIAQLNEHVVLFFFPFFLQDKISYSNLRHPKNLVLLTNFFLHTCLLQSRHFYH